MDSLKQTQPDSFLATNTNILSYQRTRDQIALLKMLALGKKDIEEGNVTDHDAFFAELEAEDVQVLSGSRSPCKTAARGDRPVNNRNQQGV